MARIHLLTREQWLPVPIQKVFAFFADAANLEAITPPFLHFRILTPLPLATKAHSLIDYTLRWRYLPIRWQTEIREWEPPVRFVDVQLRGPYRLWEHTHWFDEANGGTRARDQVRYSLPAGPIGGIAHALFVRADLEKIFDYRAARVLDLLVPPSGTASQHSQSDSAG
jgi:ligand-binding SRPBCC domain-containing protein